jgi:DNA-binding transcriptional LysR family regulator
MFDWNDLKYLLAVARHQSTTAASRALQVNQSTVQRRLVELEKGLGQALVQRQNTGYKITAFGERLIPLAQQVEQAVAALTLHVETFQREVSGIVKVTCPEPIVLRITQSNLLDRFNERYPDLKVEFVISDKYLDFAKGEVDIALRSGDNEDSALVGRMVGESLWAVYASRKYIARRGQPDSEEDLAQHDWIGLDDSMAKHRASVWLQSAGLQSRVVARNNSMLGLVNSAKAGIGLAPLPTALGDSEQDLVRILGPIPAMTRLWRVLTTPELRHTPRVAALFDYLIDEVETLRPIITG